MSSTLKALTFTIATLSLSSAFCAEEKTFCEKFEQLSAKNFELSIKNEHKNLKEYHEKTVGIASNEMTFFIDGLEMIQGEIPNYLKGHYVPEFNGEKQKYYWNHLGSFEQDGVQYKYISEMDYQAYYQEGQEIPVSFSYIYKDGEKEPVASIETAGEDYDLTICDENLHF